MKKIKTNNVGQSFSADILVVVIILLFGVLFLVISKIDNAQTKDIDAKYEEATIDSNIIVENLKITEVLDSENNVNLEKLLLVDDNQMKMDLGIQNDFCIIFEKDGKLVKIDSEKGINGVGSSDIIVNGVPCK